MRIRKLYLKDIGPFDEVEFEFKPQEKGKAEIHILTGPNGSGKTTLLQTLAIFFGSPLQNVDALLKRTRTDDSSEIKVTVEENGLNLPEFGIDRYRLIRAAESYSNSHFKSVVFAELPYLPQYARNAQEYWLPFAYNGYRQARSIQVNAIQEFKYESWQSAFNEAMIFDKQLLDKGKAFTLDQWIVNNISKRAISKEEGKIEASNSYGATIRILEEIITKIVGYKIEFGIKTSPLSLVIKSYDKELEFDVLPDGLRSTIIWIGDLLMRLDSFASLQTDFTICDDARPINEQKIFLFLDEIEVHLHPAWQRKILPVVKEFFPNATIFLTTHSPFVVNSVDGAAVYELEVKDGKAKLDKVSESKSSRSYQNVLREVFDIDKDFGQPVQSDLDLFYQYRNEILAGDEGNESKFVKVAKKLSKESIEQQSVELQSIVGFELRQINRIKGKNYSV